MTDDLNDPRLQERDEQRKRLEEVISRIQQPVHQDVLTTIEQAYENCINGISLSKENRFMSGMAFSEFILQRLRTKEPDTYIKQVEQELDAIIVPSPQFEPYRDANSMEAIKMSMARGEGAHSKIPFQVAIPLIDRLVEDAYKQALRQLLPIVQELASMAVKHDILQWKLPEPTFELPGAGE